MNRLQGALLEEAIRLVAAGNCSTEDIDTGLKDGLALRWSFMGPFETIDLNAPGGVATMLSATADLRAPVPLDAAPRRLVGAGDRPDRAGAPRPSARGALADRHRWRDRRLMALRRHKRNAASEIGT